MKSLTMLIGSATAFASILLIGGCSGADADGAQPSDGHQPHPETSWADIKQAVAMMSSTEGNTAKGVVTFTQLDGGVRIVADIEGLRPYSQHAFHIHMFGDARDSTGKSAGGHYNPEGHQHGAPDSIERHAGDLGNLQSDGKGRARYERIDSNFSIAGEKNPVLGRGVIIHAGEDKFTQPAGGAGARIAIGTIGIANPEIEPTAFGRP